MSTRSGWTIPRAVFDRMVDCAEKDYPEETCGLVFGPAGDVDGELDVVPMENIQNRLHAEDPETYDRDARTAYQFDSLAFERIRREREEAGHALRAIYHSHPEHDAYFSEKDRRDAAPAGWGPLFPDAVYIVFSVRDRRVVDVKGFAWSEDAGDFVDVEVMRGD